MVIDISAIMAILFDERERADFIHQIEIAERWLIGALTLLESEIVASKLACPILYLINQLRTE